MPLYIVNTTAGWRLQEHAPAVPCGEVVELPEDIGEEGVDRGYLIAEYPNVYQDDEHNAKFAAHRKEKKVETPAPKEKPKREKARAPHADFGREPRAGEPSDEERITIPAVADGSESTLSSDVIVSLPVVITTKMRRELKAKGHTDAEIDEMTPQQAHDALAE